MLAPAALQSDLALLRRAYTLLHPGLHRYATPAALDAAWDALAQRWAVPQPLGLAFLELSRLLAGIRCGHSYANFYNQSVATKAALFAGRDKLPLSFAWLGGSMVVTGVDEALPRGTEILALNGTPASEVLARLRPLVRADGHNEAKRDALLSPGLQRIETFDIFHPLVFGARERHELDVRLPGAAVVRSVQVDAVAERSPPVNAAAARDANPGWRFTLEAGMGVLTMPGWALYNSRWDWRGFIADACETLAAKAARGLVVDIRGNEGGLDCGDALIARFIDAPLPPAGVRRLVRFRSTPEDLRPVLDTWDGSFHRLGEGAADVGGGYFQLPDAARAIAPAGPRLKLPLAVLVDASNSSATGQFAAMVQRHGLGRLVGSATGGNQRGINGGAFFFVRLPATGLVADLPLIGTFTEGNPPDAGHQPDVAVAPTAADIATGRDVVMARAIELLRA